MSLRCQLIYGFVVFLIAAGGSTSLAQALPQADFEKLHNQLDPKDETWKSIPWQTSLLAAQRKAAKEQKMIFVWAMDGHPLGCT